MGSSNFPISIFLHFLFTVSKIHHQWILWEKGKKRRRKTPCLTFFLDGEKLQNGCTISLTLFSYYKVLFFLLLWSRILLFYLPLFFFFFFCSKRLLKKVQCRLKLLKNKRVTIVRQLKDDLSELLKHGHEQIAFDRVYIICSMYFVLKHV